MPPCLTSWLFECDDIFPCPCCHRHLSGTDNIRRVSSVVQQLIEGLLVSCTCGETVINRLYAMHATGHSTQGESEMSDGRVTTLSGILSQPHNTPLTPIEREQQTTLAKCSLATSPEENIIYLKTVGLKACTVSSQRILTFHSL